MFVKNVRKVLDGSLLLRQAQHEVLRAFQPELVEGFYCPDASLPLSFYSGYSGFLLCTQPKRQIQGAKTQKACNNKCSGNHEQNDSCCATYLVCKIQANDDNGRQ
jgi:hypothetical protein